MACSKCNKTTPCNRCKDNGCAPQVYPKCFIIDKTYSCLGLKPGDTGEDMLSVLNTACANWGSGSSINIYNSNGNLTGNRTLNQASFNLSMGFVASSNERMGLLQLPATNDILHGGYITGGGLNDIFGTRTVIDGSGGYNTFNGYFNTTTREKAVLKTRFLSGNAYQVEIECDNGTGVESELKITPDILSYGGDAGGYNLNIDRVARLYEIGDLDPQFNGTKVSIDDTAQLITLTSVDITATGYPNTRDDSVTHVPDNIRYQGTGGENLTAPLLESFKTMGAAGTMANGQAIPTVAGAVSTQLIARLRRTVDGHCEVNFTCHVDMGALGVVALFTLPATASGLAYRPSIDLVYQCVANAVTGSGDQAIGYITIAAATGIVTCTMVPVGGSVIDQDYFINFNALIPTD